MDSGQWVNGVNIANTPTYALDGKCRECGELITGIETSVVVAVEWPPDMTQRVEPAKIEGPYYVPCHHDAADAFGGKKVSSEC